MTTDHGFVINILVVFALIIDVSLLSVSEILILEEPWKTCKGCDCNTCQKCKIVQTRTHSKKKPLNQM